MLVVVFDDLWFRIDNNIYINAKVEVTVAKITLNRTPHLNSARTGTRAAQITFRAFRPHAKPGLHATTRGRRINQTGA